MNLEYDYDEVIQFCDEVAQRDIDALTIDLSLLGIDLDQCEIRFHTIGTVGAIPKIYQGFSTLIGSTQDLTGLAALAVNAANIFNTAYAQAMTDKNILENGLTNPTASMANNNLASLPRASQVAAASGAVTMAADATEVATQSAPVEETPVPTETVVQDGTTDTSSPLDQIPDENTNIAGYSDGQSDFSWDGPVLTKRGGVNQGPTGKETYYNLKMDLVVQNMKDMGFEGEYWVRDDGVKMFGDYVIVAANLDTFPRGSIVDCSLGKAIVCDTGAFAAENPTQLDIAVDW